LNTGQCRILVGAGNFKIDPELSAAQGCAAKINPYNGLILKKKNNDTFCFRALEFQDGINPSFLETELSSIRPVASTGQHRNGLNQNA